MVRLAFFATIRANMQPMLSIFVWTAQVVATLEDALPEVAEARSAVLSGEEAWEKALEVVETVGRKTKRAM